MDMQTKIKDIKEVIRQLSQTAQDLLAENEKLQAEKETLEAMLKKSELKAESLLRQIKGLEAEKQQRSENDKVAKKLTELQMENKAQTELIIQTLSSQFKENNNHVDEVLSQLASDEADARSKIRKDCLDPIRTDMKDLLALCGIEKPNSGSSDSAPEAAAPNTQVNEESAEMTSNNNEAAGTDEPDKRDDYDKGKKIDGI